MSRLADVDLSSRAAHLCALAALDERDRIREAILSAPIAFDFFGPYIARDKLMEILEGESNERTN
jgi:hypothetical protein